MMWLPASAFLTALVGYVITLWLFPKIKLVDFPQKYGLSRLPIPYPAGIVAVLTYLLFFWLQTEWMMKEWGLVAGIVILAVTSFLDDRRSLPSSVRLLVQLIVVVIIFAAGSRIYTITNPIEGFIKLDSFIMITPLFGPLPILSGIFTVGWLLLTINAMNWFDGISGQVSILSALGFLLLGLLAQFRNDQPELAVLAYTLFGIAAAGAFFDFPPAKLLLGDTGAMFFGLLLGVLGVYQGGKVATAFLAIGIPLIDAGFVIIARIARGQSPLRGGRDHLHHRLLALGYSSRSIVTATAVLGGTFGVTALFLSTSGKFIAMLMLLLIMLALHLFIVRREHQRS